jgi:hypothetical protein
LRYTKVGDAATLSALMALRGMNNGFPTTKRSAAGPLLFAFSALIVSAQPACSAGVSSPEPEARRDGGGAMASEASSSAGDSGAAPGMQAQVCADYIDCLAKISSAEVGGNVALYGPNSACWADARSAAQCATACSDGLARCSAKAEAGAPRVCPPSCTTHQQCQSMCPQIQGAVSCCDRMSQLCYAANGASCLN